MCPSPALPGTSELSLAPYPPREPRRHGRHGDSHGELQGLNGCAVDHQLPPCTLRVFRASVVHAGRGRGSRVRRSVAHRAPQPRNPTPERADRMPDPADLLPRRRAGRERCRIAGGACARSSCNFRSFGSTGAGRTVSAWLPAVFFRAATRGAFSPSNDSVGPARRAAERAA